AGGTILGGDVRRRDRAQLRQPLRAARRYTGVRDAERLHQPRRRRASARRQPVHLVRAARGAGGASDHVHRPAAAVALRRLLPAAGHLRGRAPEHVDRDVARRLERERLDQEQRATLRPRRLRGLQREPHGGHDPVRGAARAVQPVEHERRCGDAESGLHFQHELRLRRDGHFRGSGGGPSVLHPGDRRLEADAGRADRGALDPRATHPGTGRHSLLDGEHPAPEARVPAVARHLLPVRRPVLRAGPGRAPGSAHRAADPGGRGSGGGRGDQRLPQRPAVLLQAAARDAGLPGLWHVAHGARGVSIPEPEPRLGRLVPIARWFIVGFAATFSAANYAMHRIARDQPFRSWYVHLNFAIGAALISAVLYALGPTGHVVYAAYLITPLQAALYLGPTEAWQALALNLTGFGLVSAIRAAAGEGSGSLFF